MALAVSVSLVLWVVLGLFALTVLALTFRYIPNDRVGIVEKLWSPSGSVTHGIIALNGEAGFQPELLRGGWHVLMPFQYRLHQMPLVTIPQGKIGYVFARDGQPLPPTQTLAGNVTANDFQDVAAFLRAGGQRGPQRKILREGTYAINIAQFVVITSERVYFLAARRRARATRSSGWRRSSPSGDGFEPVVIKDAEDVDRHRHRARRRRRCPTGRSSRRRSATIRRRRRSYHNNFQDPEKFLQAGGLRGRQLQTLVEGTYYINRLFATVEMIPKTVIEVGNVGVVVSYTGEVGVDLSGDEYKHGELVKRHSRGVWNEPLLPGKYAFNTYAGKVMIVPTTNFILKWNRSETGVASLRREPVGSAADHQGRLRAVAAAVGGRAHRLPQGAAGDSAVRRHQAAGRADARPDGVGLLQERRPDAHADPADSGPQRDSAAVGRADEGEVRASTTSSCRRC